MTIPNTTREITHIGTGAATVFTFPFTVIDATDLRVTLVSSTYGETIQTYLTDYSVTGLGDASGSITMTTAPLAGYTLRIERVVPLTQETDIRNSSGFYPETIEDELDRLVMADQQQQEVIDRALVISRYADVGISRTLPLPEAGKILAWSTDKRSLVNATLIDANSTLSGAQVVDHFTGGVDYTAGTTTSLSLSTSVGQRNATVVTFDGLVQHKNTYSITGSTINFTSPIPVGVLTVEVQTYQTMAIGVPPPGTDASSFIVTPADGVRSSTLAERYSEVANVVDFGADPLGVSDSTAAFQDAVDTGKHVIIPGGTFILTDAITISAQGQRISGLNKSATIIDVSTLNSFNLTADGVFVVESNDVVLEKFTITFYQADVYLRTSLVVYPPAVYAPTATRCLYSNLRIQACNTGFSMRANCGGTVLDDIEISSFDKSIHIGETGVAWPLDSIKISKLHHWVFGGVGGCTAHGHAEIALGAVTGVFLDLGGAGYRDTAHKVISFVGGGGTGAAGTYTIDTGTGEITGVLLTAGGSGYTTVPKVLFHDGTAALMCDSVGRSLYVEDVDDLHVSNSLIFGGDVELLDGFGSFTGVSLDMQSALRTADGFWSFTGGYMTTADERPMIVHTGGQLTVAGTEMVGNNVNNYHITATSSDLRNRLTLTGCILRHAGDHTLWSFTDTAVIVSGCTFIIEDFWLYVAGCDPLIVADACRLNINGCSVRDKNVAQTFVQLTDSTGSYVTITDNVAPGWSLDIDNSTSASAFTVHASGNILGPSLSKSVSSTALLGPQFRRVYEGTLSGGGAATIPHLLGSNAPKCVETVGAWYKNGTGGASVLTVVVGGTNIELTGGGASALYRVVIAYGTHNTATW